MAMTVVKQLSASVCNEDEKCAEWSAKLYPYAVLCPETLLGQLVNLSLSDQALTPMLSKLLMPNSPLVFLRQFTAHACCDLQSSLCLI